MRNVWRRSDATDGTADVSPIPQASVRSDPVTQACGVAGRKRAYRCSREARANQLATRAGWRGLPMPEGVTVTEKTLAAYRRGMERRKIGLMLGLWVPCKANGRDEPREVRRESRRIILAAWKARNSKTSPGSP